MLTYVTQPSEWFFTHTRCKQLIWIFHWRTTSSFIWFLQFDSMLLAAFSDCSRLSNGPRLKSLKLHQKNHIDIDLRQQLKPAYDMFVAAMKHATAPHSTRKEMYIFICFDFQFRLHLNDNVIRGWETFRNRQTLCRQKKVHCIHLCMLQPLKELTIQGMPESISIQKFVWKSCFVASKGNAISRLGKPGENCFKWPSTKVIRSPARIDFHPYYKISTYYKILECSLLNSMM